MIQYQDLLGRFMVMLHLNTKHCGFSNWTLLSRYNPVETATYKRVCHSVSLPLPAVDKPTQGSVAQANLLEKAEQNYFTAPRSSLSTRYCVTQGTYTLRQLPNWNLAFPHPFIVLSKNHLEADRLSTTFNWEVQHYGCQLFPHCWKAAAMKIIIIYQKNDQI